MARPQKSIALFDAILESVLQEGSAGATELAAALDEPVSTVHGYLRSMEEAGWLVNDSGRYRVSTRSLRHGDRMRRNTPAGAMADPHLRELAEETGWTATLAVEESGTGVTIDRHRTTALQGVPNLGVSTRLHTTAAGKAILAHLPANRIDEIVETADFSPRTPNTVRSAEDLRGELATIREQGFALDTGEWRRGIFCVGAPILSEAVGVAGAVSVTAPDMELDDETFEEVLPEAVRRYANRIQIEIDDAHGA